MRASAWRGDTRFASRGAPTATGRVASLLGWLLALSVGGPVLAWAQAEEAVAPPPFANPRERFPSLGVQPSHFELLRDGRAVAAEEQEPIVRFLFATRRLDLSDLERWSHGPFLAAERPGQPAEPRGEVFFVHGRVKQVTREAPAVELRERFEMSHYFRCQIDLADEGGPAEVFATAVPRQWDISGPLDERVSLLGIFLKWRQADPSGEPVFVAQRVGWHPATVLGDLQMDVGLFDTVQNRTGFRGQDRECFYQLLAAVGKAGTNELLLRAQRPPGQPAYSVLPLFSEPHTQHGELLELSGTARRVLEVRVTDKNAIERFGIHSYYQIEMFTADSQNNPLTFCVLQLPPGVPVGPDVNVRLRIAGFFFKLWSYEQTQLDPQAPPARQLAPTLVGREPRLIKPQGSIVPLARTVAAVLAGAAVLGSLLAVWRFGRGDRKFHQRVFSKRYQPTDGRSLNDLGLDANDVPDFRRLEP